ncbi:alpha/beta fold hydrolase [Nocardia sp. NPDC051990]|uniref:alpha/beta fold hydrolase n=1 Tax=Nocardia sp. NPDC051990 TaxID=3155285 RepID=UPI00341AECD0
MTTCYQLLASVLPNLPGHASDLARRLGSTRWPPTPVAEGVAAVRTRLYAEAWLNWLRQEPSNTWGRHRRVETGLGEVRLVCFPGHGTTPLLLLHGWPTSFLAFHRVIEPLQQVASEVVLALLPGFGAPMPRDGGMGVSTIAAMLTEAMLGVEHERFIVHGEDWGSVIARRMAGAFPEHVAGFHVSAGLGGFIADAPECGLPWQRLREFADEGAGYLNIQARRPDSLAIGLHDSPAGLLAWQLDKYDLWQASLGAGFGLGEDFIFANATFYWATQSIGSSMRIYADNRAAGNGCPSQVPTAVSVFGAGDFASREVAARENNLLSWYEHPNGGHVAPLDAHTDFIADLSDFITHLEATPSPSDRPSCSSAEVGSPLGRGSGSPRT